MIKTKWLIYTVLIGMLPFLIRLSLYIMLSERSVSFLMNESDFIILGLVLNLSNLNELEGEKQNKWKTLMTGISAVQIAIYAGILAISYITEINSEIINEKILFWCSLFLALVSFLMSYAIYDKLNINDNNYDEIEEEKEEKEEE